MKLAAGDFLFVKRGNLESSQDWAIDKSYHSNIESTGFYHVAIVLNEATIIEAKNPQGVVIRSHADFCKEHQAEPIVKGSLLAELRGIIPQALARAQSFEGLAYDHGFSGDEGVMYCSQLVMKSFYPLFKPHPMSFKDSPKGSTLPFWIKYFEQLGQAIPEGKMGSHPNAIAQSDCLKLV